MCVCVCGISRVFLKGTCKRAKTALRNGKGFKTILMALKKMVNLIKFRAVFQTSNKVNLK
jgi:hypothetical protein